LDWEVLIYLKINMKTSSTDQNYYFTNDLGLACTISLFYPIWAVDKSNPPKAQFVFKRESGLGELLESYWSNTLHVSPLAYFQQLKIIKSRLYEQR